MSTFTQQPTPRVCLPRALHDFVVEMAIAVHKRSIYPAGHPIMMGAVGLVYTRLAEVLQERADLSIGVAERRLIIAGVWSDADHPLLSEFAGRLSAHLVGAIRFARGVSREELDAFLDAAAQPVDEAMDPLGTRREASSDHVTLLPIAFERLGLLEGQTRAIDDGHENATWH
ncbi:MAG: hypothetical protein H7066_09555, partial [Cytophagaceae bacterium]|nr:hypothetical protein [Gemmatimonadaceae bacterium]